MVVSDSDRLAPLAPLSSLRYFAALHLFVFHLHAAHLLSRRQSGSPLSFPVFDRMPTWMVTLIQRGYCSTSLFFLLSGFVLAYLYIDERGRPTVGQREFWWARFTRLYPLHVAVLLLIAPLTLWFGPTLPMTTFFGWPVPRGVFQLVGFILSATLTQAWFPEFALTWNFPTWALSTVVFFYLAFPWLVRKLKPLAQRSQTWLIALCPIVSLIPPVIYLSLAGEDRQMSFDGVDFWKQFFNEFVMRTPLFWLPHFLLGMLVARRWHLTRYAAPANASDARDRLPAWGDGCAAALAVILVVSDETWSDLLGVPAYWLRLVLRHGLLAPLYAILIRDLALQRGYLARLLSLPVLARLGDASFSIFMLQLPMMVLGVALFAVIPVGPVTQFVVLLTLTTAVSLACAALEKRVTRRLR